MGPEIAATVSSETVRTAILTGVAADTGAFGGMPPIAGLSTREAETILRYLKALNASSAGL